MIWNCNGEIKEIEFDYSEMDEEYYCWIESNFYAWEKGFINAEPWDWARAGYTEELAEWKIVRTAARKNFSIY